MSCAMHVNTLGITDTLNPGIKGKYQACFEIPSYGASNFTARFKCGWDKQQVEVDLGY
jgi:hypothetical protein